MGTNYYMMIKKKDIVEKYFPNEYELTDTPYFGYQVHIGKRSAGWRPLFKEHKNAYDSVKGMKKFIKKHQENIRIFDEYAKEFTLEQLKEELITWGEQQKIRYMKYIPEGVPDEIFGGKKYLVESTKDDYNITIPFDHVAYAKLDNPWLNIKYWHDEDGYDFTDRPFS